jgi:hypothetical protein
MPYINLTTSLKLSHEQKDKVKAEFGRLITIIPGKQEANCLLNFSDGHTMYRGGEEAPCAFIEIRLFGKAELEAKKKLTKEIFEMMNKELGIEIPRMFLNILELDTWGSAGVFKS